MRYYTAEEVANKLKVSTGHVYELVKRGELKKKEGMGRTVRIPSTELSKVATERKRFTYDKSKVEVIETHLGKVRKIKDKNLYVAGDIAKCFGVSNTKHIYMRAGSYSRIDCSVARKLGLPHCNKGLILLNSEEIRAYSDRSTLDVDWELFFKELQKVEEQLTIDEIPREDTRIKIFDNPEFGKIRTIEIENEPWFVGKDVAEILGYSNPRKAIIDHVDTEDKGVTKCDTLGGNQDLTIINESGLYSLILSSKLPGAKKFKKWVTSDVIPTIRKTGGYVDNSSKFVDNYFSNLSKNTKEIILSELENKNKCLMAERVKIDKELLDNADVIEKIQETL